MLITRDQRIVNRPAVEVREMMRALYDTSHSVGAFAEKFDLDEGECGSLINDLVEEGLIEISTESARKAYTKSETAEEVVLWQPTIKGVALAKARIGVAMSRTKAQEMLDDVLARADQVNTGDDWLHWVVEIVLYGSFAVEGDEPVGDLDLAIRLCRRYPDAEYRRLQDDMIERDDARPRDFLDQMQYAQKKVVSYLRDSSPKVDLVEIHDDEDIPPGATTKRLLRFDPPVIFG